jgi:hypothetical protein
VDLQDLVEGFPSCGPESLDHTHQHHQLEALDPRLGASERKRELVSHTDSGTLSLPLDSCSPGGS